MQDHQTKELFLSHCHQTPKPLTVYNCLPHNCLQLSVCTQASAHSGWCCTALHYSCTVQISIVCVFIYTVVVMLLLKCPFVVFLYLFYLIFILNCTHCGQQRKNFIVQGNAFPTVHMTINTSDFDLTHHLSPSIPFQSLEGDSDMPRA